MKSPSVKYRSEHRETKDSTMVQAVHAAPANAALNPTDSALMLSGQDCEGRNEDPPAFQERTLLRCDLFNGVGVDASSLLLLAQCIP
jgi:hypothetical protein